MESSWEKVEIGKYAKIQGGFAFKSKDFKECGVPVAKIKNIKHRDVDLTDCGFVEKELAEKVQNYFVRHNDVLICMTGSGTQAPNSIIGRVAKHRGNNSDFLINQRVGRFQITNSQKLDSDFLYYFLSPKERQWDFVAIATGSANQVNISGRQIESIEICLPPLTEQKAIAHILGSLDDKIELNRRMNETLEAMAQALFKSWFIDFDPVIDNILLNNRSQNQPSPLPPQGNKNTNFHGGFDFTGLLETARGLRQRQTTAEVLMWALLRNRSFMGLKFRRQHQIGEYIADFYCHEAKLVIELDGKIHEQTIAKDQKRDAYMQSIGLTVLRFTNEQLLSDPEAVLSKIANGLQKEKSSSPSGRGGSEGFPDDQNSSTFGRGQGEGFSDTIRKLFPSEFEHTEEISWIPKRWRVCSIGEKIDINPTVKLAKNTIAPFVDMKALPTTGFFVLEVITKAYSGGAKFQNGDVLLARITPCLENGKTAIADFLDGNQVGFGSTEFIVLRGKGEMKTPFVACLSRNEKFRDHCIQSMVGSSGRQRVQNACFSNFYLALPESEHLLKQFHLLTVGNFEQITKHSEQIRVLSKLRDTLLPKLLSGEMRIPEAEKLMEDLH